MSEVERVMNQNKDLNLSLQKQKLENLAIQSEL